MVRLTVLTAVIFVSLQSYAQTWAVEDFVQQRSNAYEFLYVFHQTDSAKTCIRAQDLHKEDSCFFYINRYENGNLFDEYYSKLGDNVSACLGIDSVWCYTLPTKVAVKDGSFRLHFMRTMIFVDEIDSAKIDGRYIKVPLRVYADGRIHLIYNRHDELDNYERSMWCEELYVYTKSNGRRCISKKMSPELKKIKKSKKPKWWKMGGSSYQMPHGVYYYSGVVNGKAYSGTIIY